MKFILSKYKKGDKVVVCLPLYSNIPNTKNKDWLLVQCPKCGADCWESDLARQMIKLGNIGYCTECAIIEGLNTNKK